MGFANKVIGGAAALIRAAVKSPNFVSGSAGWSINKDGSAEFDNLTLRGTFSGTDWIINPSGMFLYSGTPGPGNPPVAAMVPPGVTQDPFGAQVAAVLQLGSLSAGNPFTVFDSFGNIKLFSASGSVIIDQSPGNEAMFIYQELFGPQGPLLVSLAGKAGTDPNTGTAYPAGLFVTAGVIEGAQIIAFGSNGEILVYSGTPAAGNLIGSVSGAAGTDSFGNPFVVGTASYGAAGVAQLTDGALQVAPSTAVINAGNGATLDGTGSGFSTLTSGGQSGVDPQSSLILSSRAAGGGTSRCTIGADRTTLNNAGGPIPAGSQTLQGAAGAAYNQAFTQATVNRVNTIINQLQAAGITN